MGSSWEGPPTIPRTFGENDAKNVPLSSTIAKNLPSFDKGWWNKMRKHCPPITGDHSLVWQCNDPAWSGATKKMWRQEKMGNRFLLILDDEK